MVAGDVTVTGGLAGDGAAPWPSTPVSLPLPLGGVKLVPMPTMLLRTQL